MSSTWFYAVAISPVTWLAFVFGALVGSFLNVCILRIPSGTFWKHTRSHCPHCGAMIPFYLNIPIVSWFILAGRSRCCRSKISVQYPIVEVLTAAIFVFTYWTFPFIELSDGRWFFDSADFIRWLHATFFTCTLLVCSVIDIRLMIIPDVISLSMVLASPLVVYLHPDLTWQSSLLGVLLGAGLLYGIAWLYYMVRGEAGMGMGDVKLLGVVGGWLGYEAILPTIFIGSLLGSAIGILMVVASKQRSLRSAVPFGPFLALGAVVYFFFGQKLQDLLIKTT